MDTMYWMRIAIFLICFVITMYAFGAISYEKICKVKDPIRIYVLIFVVALISAYELMNVCLFLMFRLI